MSNTHTHTETHNFRLLAPFSWHFFALDTHTHKFKCQWAIKVAHKSMQLKVEKCACGSQQHFAKTWKQLVVETLDSALEQLSTHPQAVTSIRTSPHTHIYIRIHFWHFPCLTGVVGGFIANLARFLLPDYYFSFCLNDFHIYIKYIYLFYFIYVVVT